MLTPAPARPRPRVLPAAPVAAAVFMLAITAALYVIEFADQMTGGELDNNGIVSRRLDGLGGILWAPLLHHGWPHLVANTVPFLVFGFLAMAGGIRQFVVVTALIWVGSGLGVWLTGDGITVGASGLIFGWLVFLLARGFFVRSWKQIVLAMALFVLWGSVLWGVLPGAPQVSWQAHLFGALSGLLAAWLVAGSDRAARRAAGNAAGNGAPGY